MVLKLYGYIIFYNKFQDKYLPALWTLQFWQTGTHMERFIFE